SRLSAPGFLPVVYLTSPIVPFVHRRAIGRVGFPALITTGAPRRLVQPRSSRSLCRAGTLHTSAFSCQPRTLTWLPCACHASQSGLGLPLRFVLLPIYQHLGASSQTLTFITLHPAPPTSQCSPPIYLLIIS